MLLKSKKKGVKMITVMYFVGVLLLLALFFSAVLMKEGEELGLDISGNSYVKNTEINTMGLLRRISFFFSKKNTELPILLGVMQGSVKTLKRYLGVNSSQFLLLALIMSFTSWAGVALFLSFIVGNVLVLKLEKLFA